MIRIEECVAEGAALSGNGSTASIPQAAASVTVTIERLADGNTSKVKPIGEGAAELKINRGPGYRIYFGWDGKVLVILLGGGTRRRQQHDIDAALRRWRDYKKRKSSGR